MKITNVSNFMSYNSNTSKIKKNDVVAPKKFDTIQISKSNILDVDKLQNKIANEVNTESSADRIEFFRQQINNNTYVVDSEELARIMLSI